MRIARLLTIWGLCLLGAQAVAARPLEPDDYFRLDDLHDVQMSADGSWVAYVATANDRGADEERSSIWVASWDGNRHLPIHTGDHQARMPRFSPDGRYLAFIGSPADTGRAQIMVIDRPTGLIRALTDVSGEIGEYQWSPDGKRLVFVLESLAQPPPRTGDPPLPIVIDALYFKEDPAGYIQKGQRQHLVVIDVASGESTALAADPQFNDDQPVWSPDGRRIAFVRSHEKAADADGMSDLDVVDAVAGAKPVRLARILAPNFQHLDWSPDGRLIAFLLGREPKYNSYMQDRLALIPAAGGAVRPLGEALDRMISAYQFADADSILASVIDDMTKYPAMIDVRTGAVRRLYGAPSVVTSLATASGHIALMLTDDHTPDEVYALESGRLRRLTSHNDAALTGITLGEVSELKFRSRDGTEVHGLMFKPPGFVAGRRYPTVFWLHGGANDQDDHGLRVDEYQYKRQLLAARGYVVIGVNYRGSSGRGYDYSRAIFNDWGHREVEDVLAAAEHVVALGVADPQRLGIGGWSYGGILTDYTIARDKRFRAAASGAGAGNTLAMYGTDQYFLANNSELRPPWQAGERWIRLSYPLFHADRIHTPTLFLGGDRDFNVPIAGGEQMYEALRTLGVPTELVVYPGEAHDFTRPSFKVDKIERIAAWFDRYLRSPP